MYRDGKEIPIAGGKWPTVSNFSGILLGVVGYHPVSPYEMWIDDVAIGTERIGCPTM